MVGKYLEQTEAETWLTVSTDTYCRNLPRPRSARERKRANVCVRERDVRTEWRNSAGKILLSVSFDLSVFAFLPRMTVTATTNPGYFAICVLLTFYTFYTPHFEVVDGGCRSLAKGVVSGDPADL